MQNISILFWQDAGGKWAEFTCIIHLSRARLKRITNQVLRQNPKKCIEWKIIECRIFDEIEELSCTKRFEDIFDHLAQATSKTNTGGISKENCGHRLTLRSQ